MRRVIYLPAVRKELSALDPAVARRILRFIDERVVRGDDPRGVGEPLHGPLDKYWKYRAGPYRIVCSIQDDVVTVVIVRIGHRRAVYR